MLGLLNSGGRGGDDPLASERIATRFVRALPTADALAAQRILCDALGHAAGARMGDLARWRALVVLDRAARRLRRRLLAESVALRAGQSERHAELWLAVAQLGSAFGNRYESLLEEAIERNEDPTWRRQVPAIVTSLLGHRECDLLHAVLRYETWPSARWAGVLGAYRYALGIGMAVQPAVDGTDGGKVRAITPEQALLRLLLLHRLECGQFTPQEVIVARGWIGRWAGLVRLVVPDAALTLPPSPEGFAVDLREAKGLRRPTEADNEATGTQLLLLDTTPIVELIDREITTARIAAAQTGAAAVETARRLAVQSKLRVVLAAKAVRARRRDERAETGLVAMQVIAGGLPGIFRMLRDDARFDTARRPDDSADGASIELTAVPETSAERLATVGRTPGHARLRASHARAAEAPLSIWQVRDQSRSGCRLRGRVVAAHLVAPGTLIACRGAGAAPWMLAVVRRLKKLCGSNAELGIEFLGARPQQVVLFDDDAGRRHDRPRANATRPSSVALRLGSGNECGAFAGSTLILPAHEHRPGRVVTMLSSSGEQSIRLGEAVEHQRGFVQAPFEPCAGGVTPRFEPVP